MPTRLLSREDIRQVLSMKEVVEIAEQTFRGMGEGTVVSPPKVSLDLGETAPYPPYQGFMTAMPAYVGWLDAAGLKWAGGFLGNARIGLPYIASMILLIDPKTGQFRAAMDGALITNLRTGAQTAVALKYLHPGPTIRLGLYGAGAQGRTQTRAIAEVFPIERLTVYDIRRDAAEAFAQEMAPVVRGSVKVADRPAEVPAEAQAVVCVTTSKEKYVQAAWFAPGMVLCTLGSHPECHDQCILRADTIIVDHVSQCLQRGALRDLAQAGRVTAHSIHATLGEVAAGKKPGRRRPDERILCVLMGMGALDIAVAAVAYERAVAKGLGGEFRFV